jgi:hypothetical protein
MKLFRRHFQLLEILIALTLVVLCVIPMMQTFVQMHIEQKGAKRSVEANELMKDIHAKVTEDLYFHRISWQEIENSELKKVGDESFAKRAKLLNYDAYYQFAPKPDIRGKTGKTTEYLFTLEIFMIDSTDPKNRLTTYYYVFMRFKNHD